jgi:hypothetical protein
MNCSNCQELFSEYADRDLDGTLLLHLENHLETCPACAEEWRYFAVTISWLKEMHVAAPVDLLDGIHAKLKRSRQSVRPLTRLIRFFTSWDFSLSVPAAVVTLATAVIVMLLVKNFVDPTLLPLFGKPADHTGIEQSHQKYRNTERRFASRPNSFRQPGQQQEVAVPSRSDLDPFFRLQPMDMRTVSTEIIDPFSTLSVPDQSSAIPDALSIFQYHSMTLGHFPPDIRISLKDASPSERLTLYRKLLNDTSWSAKIFSHDTLFLYIDPCELKKLHSTLDGFISQVYPPAAQDPSFGSPKKVLTVAVRLK